MSRFYVEISGVTDEQLEMLGYYLVSRNAMWSLYNNKGDEFIVNEVQGRRYVFVTDMNDAIILGRPSIPAPPAKVNIAK